MNVQPPLIVTSSKSTGNPTPRQLAFALAKLEREKYQRILPSEFMAYAGKLPSSSMPNLSAAIGLSQLIGIWVQSCILNLDSDVTEAAVEEIEKRSALKQFFIQTARVTSTLLDPTSIDIFIHPRMQECKKIRNFSSLGAIIGALESDTITCLTTTHFDMSYADEGEYKALVKCLSPDSGYRAYRRMLGESSQPHACIMRMMLGESRSQPHACIPWHGACSGLNLILGLTSAVFSRLYA